MSDDNAEFECMSMWGESCRSFSDSLEPDASPVAKVDKLTPFLRDAAIFFWGVALGCVGFYLYVRYLFG